MRRIDGSSSSHKPNAPKPKPKKAGSSSQRDDNNAQRARQNAAINRQQRQSRGQATNAKVVKGTATGSGTQGEKRYTGAKKKPSWYYSGTGKVDAKGVKAKKPKSSSKPKPKKKDNGIPWYNDMDTLKAPVKAADRAISANADFQESLSDGLISGLGMGANFIKGEANAAWDNKENIPKAYAFLMNPLYQAKVYNDMIDFGDDGRIVQKSDEWDENVDDLKSGFRGWGAASTFAGVPGMVKGATARAGAGIAGRKAASSGADDLVGGLTRGLGLDDVAPAAHPLTMPSNAQPFVKPKAPNAPRAYSGPRGPNNAYQSKNMTEYYDNPIEDFMWNYSPGSNGISGPYRP